MQIGYVDTFSPSGAQAFALTEHNLYTVEAFEEFFDHLKPGGVLNLARPVEHNGEEALRATVLTLEALREYGVENPERNVVVILADYVTPFRGFEYGTILAKLEPFTTAELAQIKRLAARRSLTGIAYAPGGPYMRQWADRAAASSPTAFCEGYHLDVCPPDGRQAVLLQHEAPRGRGRRLHHGIARRARPGPRSADHARDPARPLRDRVRVAAASSCGSAGRPTASSLFFFAAIGLGFLRARGRADPALRPVPRLPDLRAVGRAFRAARVHRDRIAPHVQGERPAARR